MAEAKDSSILHIIRDVREEQRKKFDIQKEDFWLAVEEINKAYVPSAMTKDSERIPLDYNNPSMRYAYLVKYPIHAVALEYLLSLNAKDIKLLLSDKNTINICCLGGGPGTDVLGFSAEFCKLPESSENKFHFTVVDNKGQWESVFNDIFEIADTETHGSLGMFLKSERVSHSFVCDDLSAPSPSTLEAIGRADILALVKFVSALDPKKATKILQTLYSQMKPGSLVVFLDNSGGGSRYSADQAAEQFVQTEWGTDHQIFSIPDFDEYMWEVEARNNIAIAMKMWKKPITEDPADVKVLSEELHDLTVNNK